MHKTLSYVALKCCKLPLNLSSLQVYLESNTAGNHKPRRQDYMNYAVMKARAAQSRRKMYTQVCFNLCNIKPTKG